MPETVLPPEQWDSRKLFKRLVEQSREGKYGIEQYASLPPTLELGVAQSRVAELRSLTQEHGVEFGRTLFYDPFSRKIYFSAEPVRGISADSHTAIGGGLQEGSNPVAPLDIGYDVSTEALDQLSQATSGRLRQQLEIGVQQLAQSTTPGDILFADNALGELMREYVRRPVATIHTHTNDVPFSVGDVAQLLNELNASRLSMHILARPQGLTEALVFTPETTRFDPHTAQDSYRRWDAAVSHRMASVTGNQMTPDRTEIFTRVNEAMLRTLAIKYRFGWYQSTQENLDTLRRVA